MKKMTAFIMALMLLVLPAAALAQGTAGGALGGMLGGAPSVEREAGERETTDASDVSAAGGALGGMLGSAPSVEREAGERETTDASDVSAVGGVLGSLFESISSAGDFASDEPINPGQTHIVEPDYPVVLYTLEDAGITIELPESWLVLTMELGEESSLAKMYGLTQEDIRNTLEPMGVELYAMTNLLGSGQFYIMVMDDIAGLDMRQGVEGLDMELFTRGFMLVMPGGTLFESGLHQMGESYYTRISFADSVDNVYAASIQYSTTVAGRQYVIQYVKANSQELDERILSQLDTAVASIRFPGAE